MVTTGRKRVIIEEGGVGGAGRDPDVVVYEWSDKMEGVLQVQRREWMFRADVFSSMLLSI